MPFFICQNGDVQSTTKVHKTIHIHVPSYKHSAILTFYLKIKRSYFCNGSTQGVFLFELIGQEIQDRIYVRMNTSLQHSASFFMWAHNYRVPQWPSWLFSAFETCENTKVRRRNAKKRNTLQSIIIVFTILIVLKCYSTFVFSS